MDLNAARMFSFVVRKGSFSSAAKTMGVPVATVSRKVADLEKKLDSRLLERSTRKLRLTQAGRTLYEFVARGVEEFDAGLLALNEQEHELNGVLRLSMPPNYEPMWRVVEEFQQIYPNISLEVMVTERRIDFIEDGIDAALRIGKLNTQSAVARKLTEYSHKLVATPSFVEKYTINTLKDLIGLPCAAWGKPEQDIQWTLGDDNIQLSPKLKVNDYLQVRDAVLSGAYYSELPPFLCERLLKKGDLVELLQEYPMSKQAVSLLYPTRQNLSRIARSFIDFCLTEFKYLETN